MARKASAKASSKTSRAKTAPKKTAEKRTGAKKAPAKKAPAKKAAGASNDPAVAANDNITRALSGFIPDDLEGNEQFLDIVTWNIKWFNLQDQRRIGLIADVMSEINADVFILQEIEPGAMDPVAQMLRQAGAGYYKVAQGNTGGDQRVTILYDLEFVKATQTPGELFTDDPTVRLATGNDKSVFPRRPLRAPLTVSAGDQAPFDFELVGVHLKSQRADRNGDDGSRQRNEAAKRLAAWMLSDAGDEDVIIAGDWNALASKPEFEPIRDLEAQGMARFESFTTTGRGGTPEASHFFKNGKGTRLDYIMVSQAAARAAKDGSRVLTWSDYLKEGKSALPAIIDKVSDHMPVLARFYFEDADD